MGNPGLQDLRVFMATVAIVGVNVCAGESIKKYEPVTWQTLDPHEVARRYPTGRDGTLPKNRVTTPPEPVVVRQNHPDGPTYQEALGYTFRIYNLKFPRLARMPDGTIVMRAVDYGSLKQSMDASPVSR